MSEQPSTPKIAVLEPETSGFFALFYKEVKRFWRVSFQTVAAPVLSDFVHDDFWPRA